MTTQPLPSADDAPIAITIVPGPDASDRPSPPGPAPNHAAPPPPDPDPPPEVEDTAEADLKPDPPDGGWTAWLQVAASFALYFNHLGLINSFGVFQTYYTTTGLTSSPSAISWIGSIQIFLLLALSVIVGPLYDAGHCRALVLTGTILSSAGMALVGSATTYWHVFLSQGVCVGLGACCLQVPSIAVVPMYFKRRKARAMALATVGSGLGATLYPLIFQQLIDRVGFGWTVRAMALICLVMCAFALLVIRPIPRPRATTSYASLGFFIDRSALRDVAYLLFSSGVFFSNLSFFEPTYYIETYALVNGLSHNANLAGYLLVILNASSIPGRVIPSWFADQSFTGPGSLNTYIFICGMSCVSVFYWISVDNPAGNIAFAVLYGFFSGGVVALASVVLTDITPDMRRLGTRIGMVSILKGVGSLIGPPIAGAILDAEGEYLGVQLFSGFGFALTTGFALSLSIYLSRRRKPVVNVEQSVVLPREK